MAACSAPSSWSSCSLRVNSFGGSALGLEAPRSSATLLKDKALLSRDFPPFPGFFLESSVNRFAAGLCGVGCVGLVCSGEFCGFLLAAGALEFGGDEVSFLVSRGLDNGEGLVDRFWVSIELAVFLGFCCLGDSLCDFACFFVSNCV